MVKDGIPFVAIPIAAALFFIFLQWWLTAALLIALAAFMAYFFRDPNRKAPDGENLILSAADGRVTRIGENENGKFISVFLSPLDVHINRSPVTGRVVAVNYTRGKKMPATSDSSSLENERNSLTIDTGKFQVVCTQIAGILARRIVCWKKVGDDLLAGERIGLIKFSSRTDLLIPRDATVKVSIGDRVRGGETVIASFE